jgi:hypothetical protein
MRAHHLRLALGLAVLILALPTVAAASHAGPVYLGDENLSNSITSIRAVTNGPAFYATNEWANGIAAISYAPIGVGVYGIHEATAGSAPGVRGDTNSLAAGASGVLGMVTPTSPAAGSAGVRAINNSTSGNGVGLFASHAGSGEAVFAQSPGGVGVNASGGNIGVFGQSATGIGVDAFTAGNANSTAVRGLNLGSGNGVYGETSATALSNAGVYGYASASGGNAVGVRGDALSPDGFAGVFTGRTQFAGEAIVNGPLRTPSAGMQNLSTPDVSGRSAYTLHDPGTSPATITDFTGGANGQRLTVIWTGTQNTTIVDGGNLHLAGNFTGTTDDTLELINISGQWYELGRSVN